jgi:hypothetical protein
MKSTWGEAVTLYILGIGAELGEQCAEALSYYKESFQRFQQIHDVLYGALVLGVLVKMTARQGDKEAAHALYGQFQQLVQQARNRWRLGTLFISSGYGFQHNYKLYETAQMLYQCGLSLWQDLQRVDNGMGIILGLVGLAGIAAIEGEVARAGWLFGAADHLAPTAGFYRDIVNDQVAQARGHLDAATTATFEAAWAEGQTATLEQAIQTALQELPPRH